MATTPSSFRDIYLEQITDAFSEDLETIRQEPGLNNKKVSTLVDCLEAGINVFDTTEQQLHVAELKRKKR